MYFGLEFRRQADWQYSLRHLNLAREAHVSTVLCIVGKGTIIQIGLFFMSIIIIIIYSFIKISCQAQLTQYKNLKYK